MVATYAKAIETKDLALFRTVKPNMSAEEQRRIEAGFRAVTSQQVSVTIVSIEQRGQEASVRLRRRDTIQAGGRQQITNSEQTMTLSIDIRLGDPRDRPVRRLFVALCVVALAPTSARAQAPYNLASPVRNLATMFTDLFGPNGLIVDSEATLPVSSRTPRISTTTSSRISASSARRSSVSS